MNTYRRPANYRKIYVDFYGPIPTDETGRSYEIHHVDGNHTNNDPINLIAITIQEHHDIHFNQGDYYAAALIKLRMGISPEEKSMLMKEVNKKLISEGRHPFAGNGHLISIRTKLQVKNGKHPWSRPNHNKTMVEKGIHPFLGGKIQKATQSKLVREGKHHLQGGSVQRRVVAEGNHPSQIRVSCLCCKKEVNKSTFTRDHTNCQEPPKPSA